MGLDYAGEGLPEEEQHGRGVDTWGWSANQSGDQIAPRRRGEVSPGVYRDLAYALHETTLLARSLAAPIADDAAADDASEES
jgi:hypothetical protein